MTETAMSAQAAAHEIGRLENLRGPLERRTSGLTSMVWGVVSAAIFMSYSFVGVVADAYEPRASILMAFLWAPWVAMGVIISNTLWKSVGLVVPSLHDWKTGLKIMGVFLFATFLGGYVGYLLKVPIVEPGVILLMLGTANLFMASVGIAVTERRDRYVHAVVGTFLVGVVVAMSLLIQERDVAYAWYSLVAPSAAIIAYFGSGLYLVSRG